MKVGAASRKRTGTTHVEGRGVVEKSTTMKTTCYSAAQGECRIRLQPQWAGEICRRPRAQGSTNQVKKSLLVRSFCSFGFLIAAPQRCRWNREKRRCKVNITLVYYITLCITCKDGDTAEIVSPTGLLVNEIRRL